MAKSLDRMLQKAAATFTLVSKPQALDVWADLRESLGMGRTTPKLLGNPLDNLKIRKSIVPTWTLTLSPHSTSAEVNTCDKSTKGCRAVCVMLTAGNAFYKDVIAGRAARTIFAARHPHEFLSLLSYEVAALERRGTPFGLRLNVGSDLRWEYIAPWLFMGENVRAYDYTKWHPIDRDPLSNYRLTYSHSERMDAATVDLLIANGENVAVVFDAHKHELPDTWRGHAVIDGDVTDYRYDDPRGVIVGLAAKGSAKTHTVRGFKERGDS